MLKDEQKINRQEPILSVSEDKLNRRSFVNYVVNIINNASVIDNSFVISINGKWGEGKTSFKNLVVENLRNRKNEKNLLLEFDSINFESQKEASSNFINKIVYSIKNKRPKYKILEFIQDNKKTILLMMLFSFLIYGIFKPNVLRDASSLIIGIFTIRKLFGFLGFKKFLAIFKKQLSKISLSSLTDVISRSYLKADVVHKILYYDNLKNSYHDNAKLRNFIETKCDYDKIILFIDNFDLMEPQQIKLLIKTLNSMLCLPKFVFVLFYDKHLIEKSLNNEAYSGSEFLEKFVNIQLDLPIITNDLLFSFLQNELQEKYNLNVETFTKFKLVKKYFSSLNKIYSFLDTFNINYKIASNNLRNLKDYINKEDFLYLEIIRFFENDVYREIRKGKLELTFNKENTEEQYNTVYKEEVENYLNGLMKLINLSKNSNNLRKLIFSLFPNIGLSCPINGRELSYKNKNIGSFEYFDYYFVYDLSENIVSSANFSIIIKNINNYNLFTTNLKEIFVMNDDKLISHISSDILLKLEQKINNIIKNDNDKTKNREFIKNIVWLYSYSDKDKKTKKIVIHIFLNYFQNNFEQFLGIFKDLINEKNFTNLVYLLDLFNELKLTISKNNSVGRAYGQNILYIRKILFQHIPLLLSEKYLSFLKVNSYDLHMQKKFICKYIKNFYINCSIEDLTRNKYLKFLFTSGLFKSFKETLFNKHFDLFVYYLNFCIKRKVIGDVCYCMLNPIFIYPFDIDEIIRLYKSNNTNDTLYKLLCKVNKFNRKYAYMSNAEMIQNRKILESLYIRTNI